MGIFFAIMVGFLLLDSAVAQIPSDANLLMEVNNLSETNFSGNVSNTEGDVQYEIQRKQSVTNWVSVGFFYGSETTNWTPFDFKIHGDINPKTILRVRSWKDDGSGLPIWWQLKYFGDTGVDPNGNPAGDGYSNIQKFQNGMNPFTWYMPPKPQIYVQFLGGAGNSTKGSAVITLRDLVGTVPDYFIVERANRQLRRMTNSPYFRSGPPVINGAPNPHPGPLRPDWQNQSPFTTEPFKAVAKIQCQPNVRDYRYVETNVDTFAQPLYRIEPHYSPPLHARLDKIDATTIRGTILHVTAVPTTNGYNLTVPHPIPYARYLLLVRDKNDPQWRASGYFASGTNRSPVFLCADKKGMMSSGQSPIAMPAVKFLRDVVDPEFVAGWGEDSDGDGLPDIYEVLVTHTEPDNPDTGNTGILDGDKKMTGDGWSNTEKFRCRVDPLRLAQPPATIELKQPTRTEILKAVTPKTDLTCELQIEVRTNGATGYQPISQVPWVLLKILDFTQPDDLGNFDLRISWRFAESHSYDFGDGSYRNWPVELQAIGPLAEKIQIQLFNAFKADLATNPPLSSTDVSNRIASIMYSYRQGQMDKGIAMEEITILENLSQNYRLQDFYGKVIDQDGNPLANVSVIAELALNDGNYDGVQVQKHNASTDSKGLFEFLGLHGASLGITISKPGYENEWKNDAYQNPRSGQSTPTDRAIYRMWSTNIHEQLITGNKSFEIVPDGRAYFINLTHGTISESGTGDLKVWIQYTNQVVQGQLYDWSAGIEAVNGGLLEVPQTVMNSGFWPDPPFAMYSAPTDGYVPSFSLKSQIKGGQSGEIGNHFFYLRLKDGKEYGRMSINLFAPYGRLHPGLVCVSYAINPSGSRILR